MEEKKQGEGQTETQLEKENWRSYPSLEFAYHAAPLSVVEQGSVLAVLGLADLEREVEPLRDLDEHIDGVAGVAAVTVRVVQLEHERRLLQDDHGDLFLDKSSFSVWKFCDQPHNETEGRQGTTGTKVKHFYEHQNSKQIFSRTPSFHFCLNWSE